jgi:proline racemase/trans-L-3-hydroxyproline dehydratase
MSAPARIRTQFQKQYPERVLTIDSHTQGEPTRLVVDGCGELPGDTMAAKLDHFRKNLDGVRLRLTREPRGHRDIFGAVVTPPVNPGSHFGLFYMDARRYPHLCGHATIGAVTTLIETGALPAEAPETEIRVDTPSGTVAARVRVANAGVESVAIRMVPSFVYRTAQALEVRDFGRFRVDLVCVGGFFAMLPADQIGLDLVPANSSRLVELGMAVIAAGNRHLEVRHPLRPEVATIDVVEFYENRPDTAACGKSAVIYGEAHIDRSPCGTGTAAKMTLLHHQGKLGLNQPYLSEGLLGTVFEGCLVAEETVGGTPAVVAEIRGRAHITGMHEFVLDDRDPFPEGFLL